MIRTKLSLPALILVAASCVAGIGCGPGVTEPEGPAVSLWGRWEQSFSSPDADPGRTNLTVQLRSPSGEQREAAGFWDGGTTWRVRFMPDEEGTWRYETKWQPAANGAGPTSGFFACARKASDGNPFAEHGPIQVSGDGRYFVHADGTPFFWLADTAWNGALLSTREDWSRYLDDRVTKRFSAIQFVTTQWRTAYQNLEGRVAYSGRENITIHPEFFQRIDQRIDEINAQGLLAVPVVLWSLGEEEYTPGKLPVDQAIRLARYIVARYGAHHAAWFLGGDGDFGGEAAPYWKELGRAVFDRGDHAPAFLHPRGMRWPWDDYHGETWLTALGYQSGHGDNAETLDWIHSGPPSEKWQEGPARPIINLEPPYEDHISYHTNERHSAYNVRRASYWSLLNAPMAGVSYGAHGVWSWETTSRVPLNHDRTGEARPWHQAMALPGSMDMKHMAELLAELSWWKLRPSQHLLEEQPGADDPARFVSVALSEDDHFALAYFPVGGAARLRTGSPAGGFSSAAWVNPRTGERTPSKPSESGEYQAPSSEDWVLLLRTISSSAVPLTTTVNYHQHFLIEG